MRALGAAFGLVGLLLVVGIIGYLMFGAGGSTPLPEGGLPGGKAPRAGTVGRALDVKDSTQAQSALASLRSRIQFFQAQNGRFPSSFAELAQTSGQAIPSLPEGVDWKYDPGSGSVEIE